MHTSFLIALITITQTKTLYIDCTNNICEKSTSKHIRSKAVNSRKLSSQPTVKGVDYYEPFDIYRVQVFSVSNPSFYTFIHHLKRISNKRSNTEEFYPASVSDINELNKSNDLSQTNTFEHKPERKSKIYQVFLQGRGSKEDNDKSFLIDDFNLLKSKNNFSRCLDLHLIYSSRQSETLTRLKNLWGDEKFEKYNTLSNFDLQEEISNICNFNYATFKAIVMNLDILDIYRVSNNNINKMHNTKDDTESVTVANQKLSSSEVYDLSTDNVINEYRYAGKNLTFVNESKLKAVTNYDTEGAAESFTLSADIGINHDEIQSSTPLNLQNVYSYQATSSLKELENIYNSEIYLTSTESNYIANTSKYDQRIHNTNLLITTIIANNKPEISFNFSMPNMSITVNSLQSKKINNYESAPSFSEMRIKITKKNLKIPIIESREFPNNTVHSFVSNAELADLSNIDGNYFSTPNSKNFENLSIKKNVSSGEQIKFGTDSVTGLVTTDIVFANNSKIVENMTTPNLDGTVNESNVKSGADLQITGSLCFTFEKQKVPARIHIGIDVISMCRELKVLSVLMNFLCKCINNNNC